MVGLVQADNFFILYTFWELTSITSFLLIGIHHTDPRRVPRRCRRCS